MVVVRYLDDEWNRQQRLVRVKTLAKKYARGRDCKRVAVKYFIKPTVGCYERPSIRKRGCNENPEDNFLQSSRYWLFFAYSEFGW